MILAGRFPGDDCKQAMHVQSEMYWRNVSLMVGFAQHTLRRVEEATGTQTVLGMIHRSTPQFDHRVMQEAHDRVAAQFRWLNADWLQKEEHESDRQYDLRVAGNWQLFLVDEWRNLLQRSEFLHAVLEATAHENTDQGYRAEEQIEAVLADRYRAWSQGPPAAPAES